MSVANHLMQQWDDYRPSRLSRWALDADRVILLGLRTGRIYTIDGPGAELWQRLVDGCSWSQAAADLIRRMPPPAQARRADELQKLAKEMVSCGVLELPSESAAGNSTKRASRGRPRHISWLWCCLTLVRIDIHLRLFGLSRTIEWAYSFPVHGRSADCDATILRARKATTWAAALLPGRHHCLEQAICVFLALRRGGCDAELKLAVRGYPFLAHAWVESNGVVANDIPDYVATLIPLKET